MIRAGLQKQIQSLWEEVATARGDQWKNSFTCIDKSFVDAATGHIRCDSEEMALRLTDGLSIAPRMGCFSANLPPSALTSAQTNLPRLGTVSAFLQGDGFFWRKKSTEASTMEGHIMSRGFLGWQQKGSGPSKGSISLSRTGRTINLQY